MLEADIWLPLSNELFGGSEDKEEYLLYSWEREQQYMYMLY